MSLLLKLSYPVFVFISIFLPRNKRIWVFGCFKGYTDNTRYFFEYASDVGVFDCIWLANDIEELKLVQNTGNKAVLKCSLYGFWVSSRANMTFICTGYSDVNRLLSLTSHIINFWHGTPIKKVYLDSIHDLNRFGNNCVSRFFSRNLMKFLTGRFAFYYASNELEREIVCKAANIPLSKSVAYGVPRHDRLLKPRNEVFLSGCLKFKKIYLFAPTWRENSAWSSGFLISNYEYDKLNKILVQQDALLLIKPHPLTNRAEIECWGLISSLNIKYSSDLGLSDINDIYPLVDLLITDVSSSIFDFLIFKKPVVLFMPDAEEYLSGDRGIYNYFIKTLRESSLISWADVINSLTNTPLSIPLLERVSESVSSEAGANNKIYQDIVKRFYGN